MKKIILTGGPCAGKSTVIEFVEEAFGKRVVIVPEAATVLLSGGFPVPGRDIEWSLEWQYHFQKTIVTLQRALEVTHQQIAQASGAKTLICDRGLLDGVAYTPGGVTEFCQLYEVDRQLAEDEYALVIHLESLAVNKPELYGKSGNKNRFENSKEARELDQKTKDAWCCHKNQIVLSGRKELSEIKTEVINLITREIQP